MIDAGAPCNSKADGVNGLPGYDGIAPAELLRRARGEVRRYGSHIVNGDVRTIARTHGGFVVGLNDGRLVRARRLLATTGLSTSYLAYPGCERGGVGT